MMTCVAEVYFSLCLIYTTVCLQDWKVLMRLQAYRSLSRAFIGRLSYTYQNLRSGRVRFEIEGLLYVV